MHNIHYHVPTINPLGKLIQVKVQGPEESKSIIPYSRNTINKKKKKRVQISEHFPNDLG